MEKRSNGRIRRSPEHDQGYKRLFSHPRSVEDLLRGFLGEEWAAGLDTSTLERVGTSFVSDDLRERHSDVIWKLRWEGEPHGWFYVYLLIEFQSKPDPFMAVRLLTYVGLLLQELIREGKLAAGDRLPAVLPLVVYNGKPVWRAPLDLASLFVPMPLGLAERLPRLTYQVLDESRLELDRPDLADNLVASLFRLESARSPEELVHVARKLSTLLPSESDSELRRDVTAWWLHKFRKSLPQATIPETVDLEDAPMLEDNMREWENRVRREGRREGRQEGLEALRMVLLQLLGQRFGRLPQRVRRQVSEIASVVELRRLAKRVLQARSLQEMGLG